MQRRGVSREQWATLDGPAGIDIGASTPAEIALSILAAITAHRESIAVATKRPAEAAAQTDPTTKDPTGTGSCCQD
jgi:xanthine dehydrogenase accessory factor